MQVLFDHVGYEPGARKMLLIEAPVDTDWRDVAVVALPDGASIMQCQPVFSGAVEGWSCGP